MFLPARPTLLGDVSHPLQRYHEEWSLQSPAGAPAPLMDQYLDRLPVPAPHIVLVARANIVASRFLVHRSHVPRDAAQFPVLVIFVDPIGETIEPRAAQYIDYASWETACATTAVGMNGIFCAIALSPETADILRLPRSVDLRQSVLRESTVTEEEDSVDYLPPVPPPRSTKEPHSHSSDSSTSTIASTITTASTTNSSSDILTLLPPPWWDAVDVQIEYVSKMAIAYAIIRAVELVMIHRECAHRRFGTASHYASLSQFRAGLGGWIACGLDDDFADSQLLEKEASERDAWIGSYLLAHICFHAGVLQEFANATASRAQAEIAHRRQPSPVTRSQILDTVPMARIWADSQGCEVRFASANGTDSIDATARLLLEHLAQMRAVAFPVHFTWWHDQCLFENGRAWTKSGDDDDDEYEIRCDLLAASRSRTGTFATTGPRKWVEPFHYRLSATGQWLVPRSTLQQHIIPTLTVYIAEDVILALLVGRHRPPQIDPTLLYTLRREVGPLVRHLNAGRIHEGRSVAILRELREWTTGLSYSLLAEQYPTVYAPRVSTQRDWVIPGNLRQTSDAFPDIEALVRPSTGTAPILPACMRNLLVDRHHLKNDERIVFSHLARLGYTAADMSLFYQAHDPDFSPADFEYLRGRKPFDCRYIRNRARNIAGARPCMSCPYAEGGGGGVRCGNEIAGKTGGGPIQHPLEYVARRLQ